MGYAYEDREGRTHVRLQPRLRRRSGPCALRGGEPGWPGRRGPARLGVDSPPPVSHGIVVGYDGTALGHEAVVQAGLRAGPAGCVLVVYAYRLPPKFLGRRSFQRRLDAARAAGREALEDLFSNRDCLPDAEYIPKLMCGRPADAISRIAAARSADAIVIGLRRSGTVQALLSSVTARGLLAAPIPVVIVSESSRTGQDGAGGWSFVDASPIPEVETWW
jgi:nucleotide-binding universal stress UspA family protein